MTACNFLHQADLFLDVGNVHVVGHHLGALLDFDHVPQFESGKDRIHFLGHGERVVADHDDRYFLDLGSGQDDVIRVDISCQDQARAFALQGHQLNVGTVAAHDDGGVFVLLQPYS